MTAAQKRERATIRKREWRATIKKTGRKSRMIYFLHAPEVNRIKIGISHDPRERLSKLQAWSPVKLELLYCNSGQFSAEKVLHDQFEKHRLHGEWFHAAPEIFELIEEYKEDDKFYAQEAK